MSLRHQLTATKAAKYRALSLAPTRRRLELAADDASPVSGYTHDFYRYPARFSPQLARAIIELFSKPGDLVLDPFVGGGTTLVEAMALGRHAAGVDISSLATFVSEVKTTLFDDHELAAITRWVARAKNRVHMHGHTVHFEDYADAGYYRNLTSPETWRLRKAIEQAIGSALRLDTPRLQALARCIILRTAQWALDGRKRIPTVPEFRDALLRYGEKIVLGSHSFRLATENAVKSPPSAFCLNCSASDLDAQRAFRIQQAPTLVLTSPPYPGIHVLYHRWQVDGRKETPAPFWIANKLDGAGAAYYTLGDRKTHGLGTYFERLESSFRAVARLCDELTTFVQVVAFSEPETQLEHYLEANRRAGLIEISASLGFESRDGRLWRRVPNRKWHAYQLGDISASREVILFFRRAT